jgi:hypothetical protein
MEGHREVEIGLASSLGREEYLKMICMSAETCGGRCDAAMRQVGFSKTSLQARQTGLGGQGCRCRTFRYH